jgi:radical SAM superfamily enzyme YgiQ (UPF0313 family)
MKRDLKPVVLLQPPGVVRTFTRSKSIYPPIGLCQLAAVDRNDLISVFDAEGELLNDEQTRSILRTSGCQILGLSATSYTLDFVEKWAFFAKEIGAQVIVGGPHASLAPQDVFLKCPSVDVVVRGEGEMIINELVEHLLGIREHDLPGVCLKRDEMLYISKEILKVTDFDSLPFPRMDGLPIKNYWCPDAKQSPMITLMTSRGCPHSCAFCSSPAMMGRKVRRWSIEQIMQQLHYLYYELGVREISFVDDVFTINPKVTNELCQAIIDSGMKFTWFCNARADQINPEMARLMKQAGCHQVYLGFESGDQRVLDAIDKKATVERLKLGAQILKQAGISRSIGFVFGLPGETDESIELSIQLAKELKPERLQFTRFTPLVGSPLELYKTEGKGFHSKQRDQVGRWIRKAYKACKNSEHWGQESW